MTNRLPLIAMLATTSLAALVLSGCQQVTCAEGTHESNGTCVPGNANPDDATCGPGTELGNDGMCTPVYPPTLCDPVTTVPEVDPNTGVTTCHGTGGGGCSQDLPCPSAVNGKMNVCGRLYDVETDQQISATGATAEQCGTSGAVADGPCQLHLEFYDAVGFAQNPGTASPLAHDAIYLDDCGRYVAKNISQPSFGFLGVGVSDATGQPADHRLTGVAFAASANLTLGGVQTYVVRTDTDTAWSTAAGLSGGTFADKGAYLGIFLHGTTPVAGVTVTAADTTSAANDYYFSDTDAHTRSDVIPDGPTGINGSALEINIAGLAQMSGTGAEPAGCEWPHSQGGSIPTVLFVQPRVAEVTNSSTVCP